MNLPNFNKQLQRNRVSKKNLDDFKLYQLLFKHFSDFFFLHSFTKVEVEKLEKQKKKKIAGDAPAKPRYYLNKTHKTYSRKNTS